MAWRAEEIYLLCPLAYLVKKWGRRVRRAIGCMFLLASVMAAFTVIASALVGQTLTGASNINLPLDGGILLVAFVIYCVGMSLLSSIPSDMPRRSWFRWRREQHS